MYLVEVLGVDDTEDTTTDTGNDGHGAAGVQEGEGVHFH